MERHRDSKQGIIDVADEDRISKLPDKLITRILSFLPTEETIRTGVLARRWKSIWKQTSELKFNSALHRGMFGPHVINTLMAYQNREIHCLTVKISKEFDSLELGIIFVIACSNDVAKMVLILDEVSDAISFPVGSLNRPNTLKILKMMGNFNFNLPVYSVSSNCLKELHLYHVRFHNEPSVQQLLKGCPVLEELVLVILRGSGLFIFTIDSQSLLRLTLASRECEEENFVIKTPRLRYMTIKRLEGVDSFRIEDASELVGVNFAPHEYIMDENVLTSVNSVQFLSMSSPLKEPVGKNFHSLIQLEVYARTADWCELLTSILICSPKLQMLKLFGGFQCRGMRQWTAPACAPDCLRFSLLTLEWEDIIWDEEDDINVATYILKNASHLGKATFITWKPSNATRLQQRYQMMNQLSSVPRASNSCQVSFEDELECSSTTTSKIDPDVAEFFG